MSPVYADVGLEGTHGSGVVDGAWNGNRSAWNNYGGVEDEAECKADSAQVMGTVGERFAGIKAVCA